MSLGIITPSNVSGDALQFACIPENFYRTHGKKLVDVSKSFVWDHNPFVVRDKQADEIIDLWNYDFPHNPDWSDPFLSKSERWCAALDLKMFLRHPRLYIYEDIPQDFKPPMVTVHCTGKSRGSLSDEIIETIRQKYEKWTIMQVGGSSDKATPFIDFRGANFWESAKVIASSQIFIGLDSAMYHVARCYPRVRKKVIIQDSHFDKDQLKKFHPFRKGFDDWIDFDSEYFNEFDYDIGITNALYKI